MTDHRLLKWRLQPYIFKGDFFVLYLQERFYLLRETCAIIICLASMTFQKSMGQIIEVKVYIRISRALNTL